MTKRFIDLGGSPSLGTMRRGKSRSANLLPNRSSVSTHTSQSSYSGLGGSYLAPRERSGSVIPRELNLIAACSALPNTLPQILMSILLVISKSTTRWRS
jgi:hypothetical protein